MKLSEMPIEPIWNPNNKRYDNEKLDMETTYEIVFRNIEDNEMPSKYAIVFGTSRKIEMIARVEKTVELYNSGRIEKILFTGGKNGISSAKNNQTPEDIRKDNLDISYVINDNLSEAERMKNYCLELGVKEENIILDCISNNSNETLQNLLSFIEVKKGDNLILVTSAYHLKRCLASAKKYIPFPLTYSLVTAPTGYFESDNYYNTELGREIINFEAYHLVRLARENKIFDLEATEGLIR